MNIDYQLSICETANSASDVNVARSVPLISSKTQNNIFSNNAEPYRELSYADIKGRASTQQMVQPANCSERTAKTKQIVVPSGYDVPSIEDEKYLSVKEVAHRYSVSVATIWRWSKEDEAFPKPRIIRKGTSRWRLRELLAFENRNLEA